jgi:hypothetical protein
VRLLILTPAPVHSIRAEGLMDNYLTGSISSSLLEAWSPALEELILHRNLLSGSLPTELGLLSKATAIALWKNRLSGTIPTEIGLLEHLKRLELYFNYLTGTIPTELYVVSVASACLLSMLIYFSPRNFFI